MKIGQKLILGFLLVAGLAGFVGYVGVNSSRDASTAFEYAQEIEIPSLVATLQIKAAARQVSIKATEYCMRGAESDKKKTREALEKLDARLDAFEKAQKREVAIEGREAEEAASVEMIKDKASLFKKGVNEYLAAKDRGASQEELFEREEDVHKARRELIHLVYRQVDNEQEELRHALAATKSNVTNVGSKISILSLANVFLAILIGLFTARSISIPITKLRNAAREVGKGNLDARVDIKSNDEIGQLAVSFNEMAEDLRRYHNHLEDLVEKRTVELKTVNQQLEQEIAERKRAEEALRESIRQVQIAYDQSILYAEALNKEIGERDRAEKALADERERLDVTLRSIGDGVIATDPEGRVVLLNKVAEELTGWTHEEAVGSSLDDVFQIINEITRKRCEHPVKKVIESGRIIGLANHTVLIARDGIERILADSAAPMYGKNGGIIGVVLVFRDITEQRRSEIQLQQAQKMEAIGTLAGGIAHDFNNLLMGIQGHASLMLLHIDSDHPHFERLKGIENMVQTGTGLTKQLLGFARGGKYEVKPIDPNELIEQSSEMFGRTQKNIEINRKCEKGVWPVEVDRGQIQQVLLNLYVNAWHAMPGGGHIYIEASNVVLDEKDAKPFGVKPGNYVKISVTDTGIGMDNATQQRIFDPFFSTKEMGRGTGLGLASAYGIIKNHGGAINVYSEKGKGATFHIYLPASGKKVSITKKGVADEIPKGTETVLLVDDEDMILDVSKDMLTAIGYKVLVAGSGKEAIEVYGKHKDTIDLVIVDMIMPGMGGGEVYDRVKEINPNVKVLLSSGYSIDSEAKDILARGCNGFAQKPFSVHGLSEKIREILGSN
jgi:two-component system cell cycle sensor histidine kinase/response regulator CckA